MCNKQSNSENALKIDMSKAYDRVERDFVDALLCEMGFLDRWIGWIMPCIMTVSYAVMVNGKEDGHVKSSGGIRQIDSLSPSIFILVADVLSQGLNAEAGARKILGIKLKWCCLILTHLFFVDDVIVVPKGS